MKRFALFGAAAVASLGLSATAAGATTLTFDGAACTDGLCNGNGESISQNYGDIASQLDISYDRLLGNVNATEDLSWWSTLYSDLHGVAWGGAGDSSGTAQITLQPLAGYQVTLLGFDLGSWPNTSRSTQVTILAGDGSTLHSSGAFIVNGTTHTDLDFNFTRQDSIRIQWGPSAFNVGLDNLEFTVSAIQPGPAPIPEPATWAMMLMGFLGVGSLVRRHRTAVAAV